MKLDRLQQLESSLYDYNIIKLKVSSTTHTQQSTENGDDSGGFK